jgi:hypothetical protein
MATDNIYPIGWNTTTGKPEVASTPYSGIAGDFVSVLGGSSGGNQQTVVASNAASAVSLTVSNSASDGFSLVATGGVSGMPATALGAFGTTFADANYAGYSVFRGTPLASKNTRLQSADVLDAALPFEFHVGALSSTSMVYRIGIEGQDPITITPTTLAANTDNYNPTSFAGSEILRISASAAYNLTGIVAPATGSRCITLQNVGSFTITLVNNATSTAANRFSLSAGGNVALPAGASVTLLYDDTASFWKDIAFNSAALDSQYVQLDGGAGTQTIQRDANASTVLEIVNEDAGASASASFLLGTSAGALEFFCRNSGSTDSITTSQNLNIDSGAVTQLLVANDPKTGVNATGRFDTNDTQALTGVGDTITPTTSYMSISASGNYVLTSTPTIAAGTTQGQRLTIEYTGANTVTLQRESALAGSTLRLGAATRALSQYDTIQLLWNGTYWLEISFTDNT